jgi:hypothetical protein
MCQFVNHQLHRHHQHHPHRHHHQQQLDTQLMLAQMKANHYRQLPASAV